MSKFLDKRESLELFTREQLIGPGAFNKRFFFIEDWESNEFSGVDLKTVTALENYSEVIPEVPAYQYSSGILFPEVREVGPRTDGSGSNEETDTEEEEIPQNQSADDEDMVDDESESIISKQQNYPNSLGLSFVINKDTNPSSDLNVNVSFRTYAVIKKKKCLERGLAHWVSGYEAEIENAIQSHFSNFFRAVKKDDNLFIQPIKQFTPEEIYELDYSVLNNFLKEYIIDPLNEKFGDQISLLNEKENDKSKIGYYGVNETRPTEFYSLNSESYGYSDVYTLFEPAIVKYISEKISENLSLYNQYEWLIKSLEVYKRLHSIVLNLKSIFKKRKPTPIWSSKMHEVQLELPINPNTDKIYRSPEPIEIDSSINGLKYSVQYIPYENLVYVKVILINKNFVTLSPEEPPQLNKKDEANLKSFFGVLLKVVEKKHELLQQYNPPQLLSFDEEDSFNKVLYRQFIDYGEGYNTSVDWGMNSGFKYISTEFLPSQETPNVGYVPSKLTGGKVSPRLQDTSALSMFQLSSLSSQSDPDVIKKLNDFIDSYGKPQPNSWIEEKKAELTNEKLGDDEKQILQKQLNACEKDYQRLSRNIRLLSENPEAMSAFRIMNTAMFMQLHHGFSIKKLEGNQPFIPENNEDYYKSIAADNEYLWRSFQLAFVILNIDGFVRPQKGDNTVDDVFETGWPERNELADLVWFPTGGGKTEAYLGIIAFVISLRRIVSKEQGYGTTVLMRYTLRLLTLQQFQRATLLICALESIRKNGFTMMEGQSLGEERISIGLFVGGDSLPNYWNAGDKSMVDELKTISSDLDKGNHITTKLPFTECPWCGGSLFINSNLPNVHPNPLESEGEKDYKIDTQFNISCPSEGCTFHSRRPSNSNSLPLRIFDEDIYKFPPTLLFGTVDKLAALANNVSTSPSERNKDTRRFFGKGYNKNKNVLSCLPPELIIQDELHLLLGPLGSAVGLFEKSIDHLCTYYDEKHEEFVKPKVVTSTATTRNTDKQIFALFNRRSEIFPKQGIRCDDSFFSFYERDSDNPERILSKRKYIGVLPVGKTQVWMHLRISSIALSHRIKYLLDNFSREEIFSNSDAFQELVQVFDYYHTVLAYFNSLKDVGKTQSQLSHYLPGDVNYVTSNTIPWSFLERIIRSETEIKSSELTGRLNGAEVKTNLASIDSPWMLFRENNGVVQLNNSFPPEYVISTNMISVGIDVSRFNTIVISSMPRNIAEYIQASSRVAREKEGIVFTVHHPFRSRDISHYQKFKEFHEKFYSYVEPISVTPFASKALDRYLPMYLAVLIRHSLELELMNNDDAVRLTNEKIEQIKELIKVQIESVFINSQKLEYFLNNRSYSMKSSVEGVISHEEVNEVIRKSEILLNNWFERLQGSDEPIDLKFRNRDNLSESLFISMSNDLHPKHWKVSHSLREIDPSTVIKTVQQ